MSKGRIQFILQTQAQIEAISAGHAERIRNMESAIVTVTGLIGRLAEEQKRDE